MHGEWCNIYIIEIGLQQNRYTEDDGWGDQSASYLLLTQRPFRKLRVRARSMKEYAYVHWEKVAMRVVVRVLCVDDEVKQMRLRMWDEMTEKVSFSELYATTIDDDDDNENDGAGRASDDKVDIGFRRALTLRCSCVFRKHCPHCSLRVV